MLILDKNVPDELIVSLFFSGKCDDIIYTMKSRRNADPLTYRGVGVEYRKKFRSVSTLTRPK
jgi:hypothetical protein